MHSPDCTRGIPLVSVIDTFVLPRPGTQTVIAAGQDSESGVRLSRGRALVACARPSVAGLEQFATLTLRTSGTESSIVIVGCRPTRIIVPFDLQLDILVTSVKGCVLWTEDLETIDTPGAL